MNPKEIARLRLVNQLVGSGDRPAGAVTAAMAALQAQNYNMCLWTIGIRSGLSLAEVEQAFARGEILRTHLLRPTWHMVSAHDIRWLLSLSAPQIKATMKSRWKELELDEATCVKSTAIIEKALSGGRHQTREQLMQMLEQAGISAEGQRAAHLMVYAELEQVVCSGVPSGKQQTYALLAERAPATKEPDRAEALAELAWRYFSSRGPATLQDFVWWSGLTITDARIGLEAARSRLASERIAGQEYFRKDGMPGTANKQPAYLLPAFDELIIAYKDRTATLPHQHFSKAVSNNGIFWPVILYNGQVTGTWKRTLKKDKVVVEPQYFNPPAQTALSAVQRAARQYAGFLGLKAELSSGRDA